MEIDVLDRVESGEVTDGIIEDYDTDKEEERRRRRGTRWDDADSMDVDENDVSEDDSESDDDEMDSDEVKAPKARCRYLRSLLQSASRPALSLSPSWPTSGFNNSSCPSDCSRLVWSAPVQS